MKIAKEDMSRTRRKVLEAAGEIFAEKGFRDATIVEICRQAGANIAAVNYHFGNKEALYHEAWRFLYNESIQAYPPDGGVPETARPEERLQAQVIALLLRLTDKNNRAYSFLYREYANPTGLLKVIREEIKPLQQRTRQLLREILGPSVGEREILFCEMAIIGQCQNPMVVHGRLGQQNGGKEDPRLIDDVEAYARYVVEFALAGLAAIRLKAEARQTKSKDKVPEKENLQEAGNQTG